MFVVGVTNLKNGTLHLITFMLRILVMYLTYKEVVESPKVVPLHVLGGKHKGMLINALG